MTESEVRAKLKALKGDLLRLELDEKTGNVTHAEIHRDSRLLWKWPKESKTKLKSLPLIKYGSEFKKFSLARKIDGFEYEQMARYMEV